MATHKEFMKSTQKRVPFHTQSPPQVTVVDMEYWYPNSVWKSNLDFADWIQRLDISEFAMRLTRLRGVAFRKAVLALERPACVRVAHIQEFGV